MVNLHIISLITMQYFIEFGQSLYDSMIVPITFKGIFKIVG